MTDNTSNLVRAPNPSGLTETVQILSGERVFHSANMALEDLVQEEAAFLLFQDEVRLIKPILRRTVIETTCENKAELRESSQDMKWYPCVQASDFIGKHHETIQIVLGAGRVKRTPFKPRMPDYDRSLTSFRVLQDLMK
jgi:hypothetical protein